MKKRIVITGMGINTPLGDNLDDYYNNLIAGKSALRKWESLDASMIRSKVGGDLGNYDTKVALNSLKEKLPEDIFKRMRKILKTATFSGKISILATMSAVLDAGLIDTGIDPIRTAAILGGHNFNSNYIYNNFKTFAEEPEYINGMMGIVVFDTDIIASVSEILQIHGPVYSVGGTCTSAGIAEKHAVNEILYNDCDVAIVTGGLLDYSPLDLQALILVSAIAYKKYNDNPTAASRPYDIDREGFVPAHGSGVLILEELEHAKDRGAHIYAELLAVDSNADGNHLSNPSVDGQSALMKKTLEKAGIKPEDIDYINAHATSTMLGDRTEINSIKRVFGKHAYKLKINAAKSMLGHVGWSAATVESIAAILQMQNSKLHPSINIDNLDPEIDLDICANKSQDYEINYILKNSFGFGGLNCCSVLKKYN